MANSHPPTALDRDDEHTADCQLVDRDASCDCGRTASLVAEVRRSRSALRQVRAAIEGRTSVNVSVILSALGEQE